MNLMPDHLSDELLLDLSDHPSAREHLAACPACRRRLALLQEDLNALASALLVPEPPPHFESDLWQRLAPQLHPRPRPRPLLWRLVPAAVLLIALAFFTGAWVEHQRAAAFTRTRERILLIALSDHLARSAQLIDQLLQPRNGALVLATDRTTARRLLDENRLLRQTALHLGDQPHAALLDDLERTLLDLANSPPDTSPQDLQLLRQRVQHDRLLPKLRLTTVATREQGQTL